MKNRLFAVFVVAMIMVLVGFLIDTGLVKDQNSEAKKVMAARMVQAQQSAEYQIASMTALDTSPGVAVAINDAAANKIDTMISSGTSVSNPLLFRTSAMQRTKKALNRWCEANDVAGMATVIT